MTEFFLGRGVEQKEFRKMLRSLVGSWLARSFPTVVKGAEKVRGDRSKPRNPYICLFYGEGGMGKSTLSRRLEAIAGGELEGDRRFRNQFQTVRLDWERERQGDSELSVGHDRIEPQAVLKALHRVLVRETQGTFKEFLTVREAIAKANVKVDEAARKVGQEGQGTANAALSKKVLDGGAKVISLILQVSAPGVATKAVESMLPVGLELSAELLHQTRVFVQRSLEPKEVELYENSRKRLAQALGAGLAVVAKKCPVVVFLDTYEIVDRQECDWAMREVMRAAGTRVLWVVTGRANLADDDWRGDDTFLGYRADFSDETLFTKSLAQFSGDEIRQFFEAVVPDQALTEDQAKHIGQFSLGIPFVVQAIANLWRDGVPLEQLLAPVEEDTLGKNPRQALIKKISQRFLIHCRNEPQDLEAVYALAMVRRTKLLGVLEAMLDESDLLGRVESLRSRYSFVLESDGVRLSEKLANFVREYLLGRELERRQYGHLHERAIARLE